jgi:MFS family permease
MPASATQPESLTAGDPITRHNVCAESFFSAFNGIYMALAIFAAPVVAVTSVGADALDLTILVSAFPIGVFLGPLWATLGRRWGMQKLVTQMAIWANAPLFVVFWLDDVARLLHVDNAAVFTALITVSQLLNSAMRMGQSSLYHVMYDRRQRGRILGRLTFWTYFTMVPSVLVTGWLLDKSPEMYRVVYPLAGLCGLIGCFYYSLLHVPAADSLPRERSGFRAGVDGVERILAQDRAYLLFQLAFFLSGSAFFMSTHVVLLLTRDRFGFGAFELSLWMSVVPVLLLALSSPLWGRVLDRIGIVRVRLLISIVMTVYLGCYFGGIVVGWPLLIYLGSLLQGVYNGGGQLTWALASSHFAPRTEDVPLYNGIHFVLNGVRGLVLPWVGSVLLVVIGTGAVLAATLVSLVSIPIILRSLSLGDGPVAPPAKSDSCNGKPSKIAKDGPRAPGAS